jgi:AcrR family transcriptional regulator
MIPSVTLTKGQQARRRKRRLQYHHGDLRAAAIEAALHALDTTGQLPTLRELAAACGVAHPSLYRHFENLEALQLAVAAQCFRDHGHAVAAALARARDREPLERLRAGCEANIRHGLARPSQYALMTGPELAGKEHHREFFSAAREAYGLLVDGVAACGVANPIPVSHTIMCAMHGLIEFTRKGRTIPQRTATLDEQIAAMLDLVVAHARSHAAPRGKR